jgi:hypothetical protein
MGFPLEIPSHSRKTSYLLKVRRGNFGLPIV